MREGGRLGLDATIGGAFLRGNTNLFLRRAATGEVSPATRLEHDKERAKAEGSRRRGLVFLPVAVDSLGAMGDREAKLIHDGYAEKLATIQSDGERWAVLIEKAGIMATMSAVVQRNNATVLFAMGTPLAGGFVPEAHRPDDGADEGEGLEGEML